MGTESSGRPDPAIKPVLGKKATACWLASTAVFFAALLPSGPSFALFSDDEARRAIIDMRMRVETLNTRINELERALQNSAQSQIQLLNENERMRSEIARLRGQLEETSLATRSGKSQQKDLYVDIEKRMEEQRNATAALEAKLALLEPVIFKVNGQSYRVNAAEKAQFEALEAAMGERDFKKVIGLAQNFEKESPGSALLPEVLFAKGTALYAEKDYRASITARRDLINRFPNHPTIPQAMLNLSASLAETGNPATSRRTLEELVKKFPKSSAAAEARKRLK
jgi:tol-pal system protein YbgF